MESFPQPDITSMTAGELWAHRDALEAAAASLLGRMLFEFSRIDVNLGLCLVWVNSGVNLERLTPKVATMTFHSKLLELTKHVENKLPKGSKRRMAYDRWIERMNVARAQRNELVHGRWGVEAHLNRVVNVIGLPTGDGQRTVQYSIEELAAVNDELRWLLLELGRIRTHWPL